MTNCLFLINGPYYTMGCELWTSHFVAHYTEMHAIIFLGNAENLFGIT